MWNRRLAAAPALLVLLLLPRATPPEWRDPSPHTTRFVAVDEGVKLEVLDWGGTGRPLVLLAGGGDTAHVFDDFAQKLTPTFHVVGITRRGFGASGYSASRVGPDRLGDDVLAVLDALEISRPVLVGHSVAGQEMSSIAARHASRAAGLVYLDAGYPYAFENGRGPAWKEFQISGPQPPPPADADLAGYDALQRYYLRVLGFTYPEAELRQQRGADADGRVGKPHDFPGYATLLSGMKRHARIPVPALVIFANPHGLGTWIEKTEDPTVRDAASVYAATLAALTERQAKSIEEGVPTARVVILRGAHHYVFLSNEAEVLRELRRFVGALP